MLTAFLSGLGGGALALLGSWILNRGEQRRHKEKIDKGEKEIEAIRSELKSIKVKLGPIEGISSGFSALVESQNRSSRNRFLNDQTQILLKADRFVGEIESNLIDIDAYRDGHVDISALQLDLVKKPDFLRYQYFDSLNTEVGEMISEVDGLCDELVHDISEINFGGENDVSRRKIIELRKELKILLKTVQDLMDAVQALEFSERLNVSQV